MDKLSFLNNVDPALLEELYQSFTKDPESVEPGWRKFFEGFEFARTDFKSRKDDDCSPSAEFKVINLIEDYRKRGHLFTRTNPVRTRRKYTPTLDLKNYGLSESDLETPFEAGHEIGIGKATLKEIIQFLEQTYCQSIGVEYAFIRNTQVVSWLQSKWKNAGIPRISAKSRNSGYCTT